MKHTSTVDLKDIIEKITEMEKICFDEPWTYGIPAVINAPYSVYVVEDYGYAFGTNLGGVECELLRFAVLPEFRGQGKGEYILRQFLEKSGDSCVFLEVASANTIALKLYEKFGFVQTGIRKNYYKDDDAITMRLSSNREVDHENQ
ncbi:MAG: GNAT family N-acetyltransferase [Oscillospiraceae bacterium]|nr:GNAT family N-acetyltransferase [Oscillospiraceae bacterium]